MTRPAPSAWHQGISLKHVCTLLEANMNNDLKSLPERFQLESVDVWLQRFEKQLDVLASRENSPVESNENATAQAKCEAKTKEPGKDDPAAVSQTAGSSSFAEKADPHIYLRTLLEFLLQYYEDCITCLTTGIISLFPMLIEYANEDESEHIDAFKDVDIKNNASMLVHEYMSSLLVTEKFADSFLDVLINKAATAALREFRRTHRDDWENTVKIIGPELVYKIENAIAPIYYA
uniref:DUF3437 domain-containing protein n=1 Tax=Angiostrongylus cantonensis TaxID=6313 RepID=A0A0K0D4K6_ANGCA